MGGRIHGFLGGVLLTASLTYLTALQIRKNRDIVCSSIREYESILESRNEPIIPKSDIINYTSRATTLETAKDIWNAELTKSVNWLYSIQWFEAGQKLLSNVESLSGKKDT
ncbi:unnamed protein product [Kuraishia capsulata CBS 1993]|uniref:MICOS complex subunit MIC12 n=1 Tax=Kuraishia capsulata CBS 1993 TaxID=1382522 RepID=W6MF52_9ASCO|nr:uncharacterized protein KUCA_T00000244001 [Kuraishia capsulata CBS 1993]CDK24284.1 unnamed protein product [Kuraishia capsulata CBS 1993]